MAFGLDKVVPWGRSFPSRHLDTVTKLLKNDGLHVKIEPVPYELQKGGNRILRVRASRELGEAKKPSVRGQNSLEVWRLDGLSL